MTEFIKKIFGKRKQESSNQGPTYDATVPAEFPPGFVREEFDPNSPQTDGEWLMTRVFESRRSIIGKRNSEGRMEYREIDQKGSVDDNLE